MKLKNRFINLALSLIFIGQIEGLAFIEYFYFNQMPSCCCCCCVSRLQRTKHKFCRKNMYGIFTVEQPYNILEWFTGKCFQIRRLSTVADIPVVSTHNERHGPFPATPVPHSLHFCRASNGVRRSHCLVNSIHNNLPVEADAFNYPDPCNCCYSCSSITLGFHRHRSLFPLLRHRAPRVRVCVCATIF